MSEKNKVKPYCWQTDHSRFTKLNKVQNKQQK